MGGLGDDVDYGDCKPIKGENDERIVKGIQIVEKIKKRLDEVIRNINGSLISIAYGKMLKEKITHLRNLLCYANIDKMAVLYDFLGETYNQEGFCIYCGQLYPGHTSLCLWKEIRNWYNELYNLGYRKSSWDNREILPEECKPPKKEKPMEKCDTSFELERLNKVKDFFGLEGDLEDVKADTLLMKSADKFRTKNAEHGNAYLKVGVILNQLFPNGITLKTVHEFNKFTTLLQMIYKMVRMCNTCFDKDKKLIHDSEFDSPNDLGIYGHIFGEIQIKEILEEGASNI